MSFIIVLNQFRSIYHQNNKRELIWNNQKGNNERRIESAS
uniref:Uncharacterized protein n=1 Tax=Nelumbo nucifera TaxID=4432 RepID=A0A822XHL7_NELNU|nr:TPA_asm: hypothetical protein HUJ06_022437 [Nelumbo nucifera]